MQSEHSLARRHLLILGCIFAATLFLRFAPLSWLADGPSCVIHTYLHFNCPFCGMTRDFTAILHGQQPHLNPFSWLAAITVYLIYPAFFLWAWSRQRLSLFHLPAVHKGIAIALVVMLIGNNLPR